MLPPSLSARVSELLESVPPARLKKAVEDLSSRYRNPTDTRPPVRSELDALAYLAYRMPATYAAASAVLSEVARLRPAWHPRTLVDAGAGPGTAAWATLETWPEVQDVVLIESSPFMRTLGEALESAVDHPCLRWVAADVASTTDLPAADLVIACYVLGELPSPAEAVRRLWKAATDTLVLIEPGTPRGFAFLRAARAELIAGDAMTLAPCTHDASCPLRPDDWCHFTQRLNRTRSHRQSKGAEAPFEDEPYSYVVLTRSAQPVGGLRVVRRPRVRSGLVSLTTCSADGIDQLVVSRRDRDVYAQARRARWGDRLDVAGRDA